MCSLQIDDCCQQWIITSGVHRLFEVQGRKYSTFATEEGTSARVLGSQEGSLSCFNQPTGHFCPPCTPLTMRLVENENGGSEEVMIPTEEKIHNDAYDCLFTLSDNVYLGFVANSL